MDPDEDRQLIKELRVAVEHRTTIGIALGVLMERLDLDSDGAFAYLRRVSSHQNRKLYDIAGEIAATRVLPTEARDPTPRSTH